MSVCIVNLCVTYNIVVYTYNMSYVAHQFTMHTCIKKTIYFKMYVAFIRIKWQYFFELLKG